jgi:hypothetical protein
VACGGNARQAEALAPTREVSGTPTLKLRTRRGLTYRIVDGKTVCCLQRLRIDPHRHEQLLRCRGAVNKT